MPKDILFVDLEPTAQLFEEIVVCRDRRCGRRRSLGDWQRELR
jgi:hypothetical protein